MGLCPIMAAALAAASSIAFLSGDADVVDFVQHFIPDMRKVVPLIVSMLTLSMNDFAKPVMDKFYEAEVKWHQDHDPNSGEQSSTFFARVDELKKLTEKRAVHVFSDSSFTMSEYFRPKITNDKSGAEVCLKLCSPFLV